MAETSHKASKDFFTHIAEMKKGQISIDIGLKKVQDVPKAPTKLHQSSVRPYIASRYGISVGRLDDFGSGGARPPQ